MKTPKELRRIFGEDFYGFFIFILYYTGALQLKRIDKCWWAKPRKYHPTSWLIIFILFSGECLMAFIEICRDWISEDFFVLEPFEETEEDE